MQASLSSLLLALAAMLFLVCLTPTESAALRQKRELLDPSLTAAVLKELLDDLSKEHHPNSKRGRVDFGYNSRYGVASSVGSKLMALKQAADWNGPGRKRRASLQEKP